MRLLTDPQKIRIIQRDSLTLEGRKDSLGIIKDFSFYGINFQELGDDIPGNARIILEISNKYEFHRLELGTKDLPETKSNIPVPLSDKSLLRWYLFLAVNKKIVARTGPNFSPVFPGDIDSQGLLKVTPSPLGEILWRVKCVGPDSILLVNNCPQLDMVQKLKQPLYRALIVPKACEDVLRCYADASEGDSDDWRGKWQIFLKSKGLIDLNENPNEHEKEEWVEDTLARIADIFLLKTEWVKSIHESQME